MFIHGDYMKKQIDDNEFRLLARNELTDDELHEISIGRWRKKERLIRGKAMRAIRGCDTCPYGQFGVLSSCNVDGICDVQRNNYDNRKTDG